MSRAPLDPKYPFAAPSMCEGKESFASPSLAKSVAKRMARGGKTVESYRCDLCRQFHIGRPVRSRMQARRRNFLKAVKA